MWLDHAPRACAHIVWQIRITNPRCSGVVKLVWHVHVLRMSTDREQEELMNAIANQYCRRDEQVKYSLTKF